MINPYDGLNKIQAIFEFNDQAFLHAEKEIVKDDLRRHKLIELLKTEAIDINLEDNIFTESPEVPGFQF